MFAKNMPNDSFNKIRAKYLLNCFTVVLAETGVKPLFKQAKTQYCGVNELFKKYQSQFIFHFTNFCTA